MTNTWSGKQSTLDPQFINRKELDASYISGYKIKGYWYFDKRQGELKYRLIARCVRLLLKLEMLVTIMQMLLTYVLGVFPCGQRHLYMKSKAFNDKNSAMPITFDHLLNSRRFNGEIYKEENVYGDREIQQYMKDNSQESAFRIRKG